MVEWKEYQLGKALKIESGGTPSTKEESYYSGNISWITPRDLSNTDDKYILKGERNITIEGLKNSSAKLLPEGTVLMSSRAPIGYVAIAQKELCTNQGFKNFICDEKTIHNEYLYYFLSTKKGYFERIASGSTFLEISASTLKSLVFKFPSYKEQKSVAKILSTLDKKIALLRQQNDTLEAIAQTLFKEWFVKFEFPDANGQPYRSSGGELMSSELGDVPLGWEVLSLSEIVEISSSKRIFLSEYVKEGIPFFRGKEIIKMNAGNQISDKLFISNERYQEIKNKFGVPKKGDILITSVGTIGVPYLIPDNKPFYFKDGNLTWIKAYKTYIDSFFIYTWLISKNTQKIIEQSTIGSTQKALTIKALNALNIVIPDEKTFDKFKRHFKINRTKIQNNTKEIQTLTHLRDTLLPKLMSGKLRVQS